jgi:hypothetical protein
MLNKVMKIVLRVHLKYQKKQNISVHVIQAIAVANGQGGEGDETHSRVHQLESYLESNAIYIT